MKLKKVMGVVAAAAMALSLTACGAVDIASIGLPETLDMEKGESTQLEIAYDAGDASAEAIAEAAEKLELVWASSDEAVAVVDEEGNVTAVDAGEADITVSVKDGNLTSTCKVTVTIPIEGVEVPESLELVIGETDSAELNAKLLPEGATGATLTYESSDEAVATVDENGVVTAVGNGECVITTTATAEVQAEEPVAESEPASSSDASSTAAVSASTDVSDSASASTSEAADADEAAPAEDVQTWTAETKVTVTGAEEEDNASGNNTGTTSNGKKGTTSSGGVTTSGGKTSTGSNGTTGGVNTGSAGGATTTPTQPSNPAPAPQPDPAPAPAPDPTPAPPTVVEGEGSAVGQDNVVIGGKPTGEEDGGDAEYVPRP